MNDRERAQAHYANGIQLAGGRGGLAFIRRANKWAHLDDIHVDNFPSPSRKCNSDKSQTDQTVTASRRTLADVIYRFSPSKQLINDRIDCLCQNNLPNDTKYDWLDGFNGLNGNWLGNRSRLGHWNVTPSNWWWILPKATKDLGDEPFENRKLFSCGAASSIRRNAFEMICESISNARSHNWPLTRLTVGHNASRCVVDVCLFTQRNKKNHEIKNAFERAQVELLSVLAFEWSVCHSLKSWTVSFGRLLATKWSIHGAHPNVLLTVFNATHSRR